MVARPGPGIGPFEVVQCDVHLRYANMQMRGPSWHVKVKVSRSTTCTVFLLHPFSGGKFYRGSCSRPAVFKYPTPLDWILSAQFGSRPTRISASSKPILSTEAEVLTNHLSPVEGSRSNFSLPVQFSVSTTTLAKFPHHKWRCSTSGSCV